MRRSANGKKLLASYAHLVRMLGGAVVAALVIFLVPLESSAYASSTVEAPSGVVATAGAGSVTVSWDAPVESATAYEVGYRLAGARDPFTRFFEASSVRIDESGRPYLVVDELVNGQGYFLHLTALQGDVRSARSVTVAATPRLPALPAPSGVVATAGAGSVTVSWDAPVDTGMLSIPAGGFLVLDEADFGFGLGAGDSARLFSADGVTVIDEYSWGSHAAVTYARCPDGIGAFVDAVSATKGAANDCGQVSPYAHLKINEVESNGGTPGDWVELVNTGTSPVEVTGLIFKDNNNSNSYTIGNAQIPAGGFLVLDEADFGFGLGAGDSARLFSADGVTVIDEYSWGSHAAVTYARCPDGIGAFVDAVSATKGAANDCGQVSPYAHLKINEVESNGGTPGDWVELVNTGTSPVEVTGLIFKDNNNSNSYTIPRSASPGAITGYEVEYRLSGSRTWTSLSAPGDATSFRASDLAPGVQHYFRIRALQDGGASGWSTTTAATPAAVTLPPGPDLSATALLDSWDGFRVSWRSLEDGGRSISGLQISYRKIDESTWSPLISVPVTDTEHVIEGLEPGHTYMIRARAANSLGWGPFGTQVRRTLPVKSSLPVVTITTANAAPILDTETYIPGEYTIRSGDGSETLASGGLQIRGRGNTTWYQPKKPYRLKLDQAADVLGMGEDRDWALLANHFDRSFVRNSSAFFLGQRTDLAWTPESRPVEVVLNGTYLGLYDLAEHVKIDSDRIDIDELRSIDSSEPEITGGYSLELDARLNLATELGFRTPRNQLIAIDDPDPITPEQLAYITQFFTDAEAAVYRSGSDTGEPHFSEYLDVDSFVDWYLVEELLRNHDAWYSSAKMHKPRGGLLTMGPLWDFDRSMGTPIASLPNLSTGWYVRNTSYYLRLFRDAGFEQRVTERWHELSDAFAELGPALEALEGELSTAAANDKLVWGYSESFSEEISKVKAWYAERHGWISDQLGTSG